MDDMLEKQLGRNQHQFGAIQGLARNGTRSSSLWLASYCCQFQSLPNDGAYQDDWSGARRCSLPGMQADPICTVQPLQQEMACAGAVEHVNVKTSETSRLSRLAAS